ncbi:MAG: HEAT repeat domain-containing protein [Desulfobacteraceae bacterium]|nr:HEAT repeat domain-containing protein [Desulfobacteraceae bacterium]
MKPHLIIVKFVAADRLEAFHDQLQTGSRDLALKRPLPEDTKIVLFLTAPDMEAPVVENAVVTQHTEDNTRIALVNGSGKQIIPTLPEQSAGSRSSNAPGPASFEWIQEVVSEQEREVESEPAAGFADRFAEENKTPDPDERERIRPVGKWLMKLARAILHTGYHDTQYPGDADAGPKLHQEFQQVLGDCPEMVLSLEENRQQTDIVISGILDAPVSVQTAVGKGSASQYVSRLFEYFEQKKLLSIAIKKNISADHFRAFVRIMSDPKADQSGAREAGRVLTAALVEHNITEVSAVFDNDQLDFEKNLPWRVAIAMQRLAKDLMLLPMFSGISEEKAQKRKEQSVGDIIRPLHHPKGFNDFLVNCYIIADYVTHMEPSEIENILVDALPADLLPATGVYTFEELDWLNEKIAADPGNQRILERLEAIRRILKRMAGRVVTENISGAEAFLAYLYENEIVSFEHLSEDARYIIKSRTMAEDIRAHADAYIEGFVSAADDDTAMVYIRCFRRVVPVFIENRQWEVLESLSRGLMESREGNTARDLEIFDQVFSPHLVRLCRAYENADDPERDRLDDVLARLGYPGIRVLGKILSETPDRKLRARVVDRLAALAEDARKWVIDVLSDLDRPWYVHRNALMILRQVSTDAKDARLAEAFLNHDHPRLRLEALGAIVALKPPNAERHVTELLSDPDSHVNWRAMKAITELPVKNPDTVDRILDLITDIPLGHLKENSPRLKQAAALMTALSALSDISASTRLESQILEWIQPMGTGGKKRLSLLKRNSQAQAEIHVLKAAIGLLGKVGGDFSVSFLKDLARANPDLAGQVDQAIDSIEKAKKDTAS